MSRVGRLTIAVPPKVKVSIDGAWVRAEGPKGKGAIEVPAAHLSIIDSTAPPNTSEMATLPSFGKIVEIRRWMAGPKRRGRASQVVSGLAHINRSPSTMRK